jgi:hypothetical protein
MSDQEIFALLTLLTHLNRSVTFYKIPRSNSRVRKYKYTNISETLLVSILRVFIPSMLLPNRSALFLYHIMFSSHK